MELTLVRVMNPNPRALLVMNGGDLLERIPEKGEGTFVVTDRLKFVVAKGKSLVVLHGLSGAWDGEEWIQAIGPTPSAPDPEEAMQDPPRRTGTHGP